MLQTIVVAGLLWGQQAAPPPVTAVARNHEHDVVLKAIADAKWRCELGDLRR